MTFLEPLAFNSRDRSSVVHVVGATSLEGVLLTTLLVQEGFTHVVVHTLCERERVDREMLASLALAPEEKKRLFDRTRDWSVEWRCGEQYLSDIESADLIFVPQSWALYEENAKLHELSQPLYTIMHAYLELAPCTTIGVTGSNGKTTTSHLITHLLQQGGVEAYLSGNYRHGSQLLLELSDLSHDAVLVLEISNRHLNQGLAVHPDIAVVTNVTPNHLTEYPNFEAYAEVKSQLIGPNSLAVLNADNLPSVGFEGLGRKEIWFSVERQVEGAYVQGEDLFVEGERICAKSDMPLPGAHNIENALAAFLAVSPWEFSADVLANGVRSFTGVPERLETIAKIDGVEVVNDFEATSPDATMRAIEAFSDRPLSVVLGGDPKGVDLTAFIDFLREYPSVSLFGVESEVVSALVEASVPVAVVTTATEAIVAAHKNTPRGGVVLLSPAAAYFRSRYLYKTTNEENRTLEEIISLLQSSSPLLDRST